MKLQMLLITFLALSSFVYSDIKTEQLNELKENSHKAFSSLLFITKSIKDKKEISFYLESPKFTISISPSMKEKISKTMTVAHNKKIFEINEKAYLFAFNKIIPNMINYYYAIETPKGIYCLKATVTEIKNKHTLYNVSITSSLKEMQNYLKKYGFGSQMTYSPCRY